MSSTNRGSVRNRNDYYITPEWCISNFLSKFIEIERLDLNSMFILDPCAGGDTGNPMAYPAALMPFGVSEMTTVDIRDDSPAIYKQDYLSSEQIDIFDIIIGNPPFNVSLQFVQKALREVNSFGYVVMLLRLSFFASKERKTFLQKSTPKYCFVSSRRPSFIRGGNDSCDYAHFVWQKSYNEKYTKTYIV